MVNSLDIPQFIQDVIDASSVKQGQIRAITSSDLDAVGNFHPTWICVDEQWLYIIEQQDIKGVRAGTATGRLVNKYLLTEIEELRCEFFVGSTALIAKMKNGERIISRGSKGKGGELSQFSRLVNALLKNEKFNAAAFGERERNNKCPKCGKLYPDPNRPVCPECIDKKTLFKRVLALTPKYKWPIAAMIFIMFISSLMGLAGPYLTGRVLIDEALVAGGKYEGMIGQVVLVTILVNILALVLGIFHGRINAGVTAEIIYDLKTMIFSAMQRLSLSFYNKRQTGSLMTRVNNDAMDLQNFFHDGVPYFIVNSVKLVGVTILLLVMNWRLTLLIYLPIPIILLFIYKVFPYLWRLHSRRFRANAALNSVVNDSLTGVRVVKAFGKEDEEIKRFSTRNARVYDVQMSIGNLSSTLFPSMSFIMGLGQLIVWGVGGWDVVTGRMTFGTLISFTGYIGMLYEPIRFMTEIVDWWSSSMNSAQRIFEIIDSNDYLPLPEKPVRIPSIKGNVSAKDVEFGYEEGKPILQEVNFQVETGEMIGLVGRSGAGKSTMINLISRLYDVDQGSICIDGVNIKDIAQEDLHRQIGMVLQETFLFQGSILENIAYAKPDATPEEVIRAARIANAHDFIIKLPDGYETVIGRRGQDLSVGERQRLAIARAILLDPKILILDEATANIDTETEQLIQEALEQLVKGRTTFAIAHRLSTLRRADRLFVLDKGKIVEIGSHEQLLEKQGVYEKLFTTQREALEFIAVGG